MSGGFRQGAETEQQRWYTYSDSRAATTEHRLSDHPSGRKQGQSRRAKRTSMERKPIRSEEIPQEITQVRHSEGFPLLADQQLEQRWGHLRLLAAGSLALSRCT